VIVVNDGSTDATADVLAKLPGIEVATHERKCGKGAAIQRGFQIAVEHGYTHVITMDADGQHKAGDLPTFLDTIVDRPQAIVIGARELPGGRRATKTALLRINSNFWVWVATGQRISDTQSGYRAYPLQVVQGLCLRTSQYDWEIEILVKALWTGAQVVSVGVTTFYGEGTESQFRPLRDFALVTRLNIHLIAQRLLLPRSMLQSVHIRREPGETLMQRVRRHWGEAVREGADCPRRFAASIGVGIFFGILPIWGFQVMGALLAAHVLRLSKPLTVASSHISVPAAIPFILYASLLMGRLVFTFQLDPSLELADADAAYIRSSLAEYVVGAILLALMAGVTSSILAFIPARAIAAVRHKSPR
jgi:uncharacterized protein (DUF2062 family)